MDSSLLALIRKYDKPGPRYTSYPPAPVFSPEFGPAEYEKAIAETELNPAAPDLSLYVHIPFCDTLCYFCGCTTVITQNLDRISRYLGYLKREINLLSPKLHPSRRVHQLHWGGGTPTYLSPSQIEELGETLRRSFAMSPDAEVSVEVDPRDITWFHMKALRDVGFNRISLGVQDFDPRVQSAVNRNQSEFVTRQAIDWSRDLGFASLNMDLIYGLPLQTRESFEQTLRKVVEISPDRIAVYNFAYVPWMKKQQKLIHPEDLPIAEEKLEMLALTVDLLTASGYEYIGMDHFAKPEDELTAARRNGTLRRNFQGYSTKAGSDLYALGMSAISHFGGTYAQNEKTLPEYEHAIENGRFATHVGYRMTTDDEIRKQVIMGLMCDLKLSRKSVESRYGISFNDYFSDSLTKLVPLAEDGLLRDDGSTIEVTSNGRLFLRNIVLCFDAHTAAAQAGRPVYSRTV